MGIIIPREFDPSICSLCDNDAIALITVIMMIMDKFPDKKIQAEVEVAVCQQHRLVLPIILEKSLKTPERKLIIL